MMCVRAATTAPGETVERSRVHSSLSNQSTNNVAGSAGNIGNFGLVRANGCP